MWGYNYYGQLGNGTTNDSSMPIKIMDNVVSVSLGRGHSAAITEDGSLYMWGYNNHGQLGNGTTTDSSMPIKIEISPATETNTISATYNVPAIAKTAVFEETAEEPVEDSAEDFARSTTLTDLSPNMLYNFYVLHSAEADDPLHPANLLYLTQFTADSAGMAALSYNLLFADEDAVTLAVPVEKSISGASIQLDDVVYTGGTVSPAPVVAVNGVILTEGIDYVLSGDVTVSDYGAYLLTITGTGDYSGEITTAYFVVCAHDYVNGICSICGEIENIEDTESLKGDINLDGRATIADADLLMRIVAEDDTLKPEKESMNRADIDGDGLITILDCTYLLDKLT